MFGMKIDVDEGSDGCARTLPRSRGVLERGGECGKRLDFLMQELNREANTKARETTQTAMELKVLIEQMREQIQNIE